MITYTVITLFVAWVTLTVETELPVYRLKGTSFRLTVEDLQHLQINRISWKFNQNKMMEYEPGDEDLKYFSDYAKKTEFDSKNFSLLIKHLVETNQGLYTARIDYNSGEESEKVKYRLYVQEAVSKPVIRMKSLSLSSAEGFCNVSVNCSVRDSWVYYTCDQTQCSQTEPQSWPDVNITVTVYNGNIICTGSNRVSKETQSEPLRHACEGMNTDGPSESPSSGYIVLILSIVCLCLVCIGFICFKRRHNMYIRNSEGELGRDGANATYTVSPTADRASPPNTPQDNTVYCTVGHPMDQPPRAPPPAHCDVTSVYSQVKK